MRPATEAVSAPILRRALSYRKFAGEALRIVVLDSGYHLQNECLDTLRRMGHVARAVTVRGERPFSDLLAHILRALIAFKPDFILAINHLGFDRDGTLGGLLDEIRMPLAVWYVDSPLFVLRSSALPAPQMSSIFTWDNAYLSALLHAGAQDVHYLPLAADSAMLRDFNEQSATSRTALFVGDSMQHAQLKWSNRIPKASHPACDRLTDRLLAERRILCDLIAPDTTIKDGDWDMLALATFRATGVYRARILKALDNKKLSIVGDAGWRDVLPNAAIHPPVAYGPALAQAFRSADININATSLQMPSAVNQRVFDVPASDAFLLTDNQADMHRHFDLPKSPVLFDCPGRARELCDFYAAKPALRARITADFKQQIYQRHTYAHRLGDLLCHMQRRHRIPSTHLKEPRSCAHQSL